MRMARGEFEDSNLTAVHPTHMLMRDEDGRKKQARSSKQQRKATHVHVAQYGELHVHVVCYVQEVLQGGRSEW